MDGGDHRLDVRPGGDLRDDASEAGVLLDRRSERVGQQDPVAHDADAGLVAGGLEAQDGGHRLSRRRAEPAMTSASAPEGW